jgi:protein-L-isoaspartate(D-aspartate) O-methyltransferase
MAALRQTMVDSQLRTVGIIDADVVAAMASVAREAFVPPGHRGLAYADAALEVAPGRWLLEPMALGLLLQNARLRAGERLLVIGTASGYSAAIAAHMGARVTALESDPALAAPLAALSHVTVANGPLADGWAAGAPYDVILFEGAIETLPAAILAQLAHGGRIAAVVRIGGVGHAFAGVVTAGESMAALAGRAFLEVAARPLPGFGRAPAFAF